MVCAERKRHIQAGHDNDVKDLRGHVAYHIHDGKAQGLQGRNIATIEVVEIGVDQVRDNARHDAVDADKNDGVLPIALCGCIDVQRNDQHKCKHDKIVEGHGVKIEVILKIPRDIARTVDQVGVNSGQDKDCGDKNHGNAGYLVFVLAAIKGKRRQGEEDK